MNLAPAAQATVYKSGSTFTAGTLFIPVGIGVDQTSHTVYLSGHFGSGSLHAFDTTGAETTFGSGYYQGLAVNQGNHNLYAYSFTNALMEAYDSSGNPTGNPFAVAAGQTGNSGIDSAGHLYVIDPGANVVNVYDPTSTTPSMPLQTVDCSACPAPAAFNFGKISQNSSAVALDSAGQIYVADSGNSRVVRFDASGVNPTLFHTGALETLAVNTSNNHVFVGGNDGSGFHVTELDPAGNPVADFGLGTIADALESAKVAVDASTGAVYVSDIDEGVTAVSVYQFLPIVPVPITTAPTALAQTTATLNGTVNPKNGGAISDCHFDYGPTAAYGQSAPCTSKPANGNSAVAVHANLSGLSANGKYHYQLVVDNGAGPQKGADEALTTLPNPPTATTGGSSSVSQHTATIAGTVNPGGAPVMGCQLEYGATTAYGSKAPCPTAPGEGSSDVAESLTLTGLAASTTYHYRLVAENAGGAGKGSDMTFATTTETCQSNAALCPPPPGPVVIQTDPGRKPLKCKKGFKKKKVHGKTKCVKVRQHHKKHHR